MMKRFLISVTIGILAGAIDIIPMFFQGIGLYACASAFVHWVILGIFISYIHLPLAPFLKGVFVAVLSCIPIVILIAESDAKSVVPIVAMSVILGASVGWATSKITR